MADATPEQFLSGQALARDRATTAKEVTFDLGEWSVKTNAIDYRGYDVEQHDDPAFEESWKSLLDEKDGLFRLAKHTLSKSQTKITDFRSFKKAFEEAWGNNIPEKGASILWDKLSRQDAKLIEVYSQPDIQEAITKNGEEDGAKELQKQFAHLRPKENPFTIQEARQLWKQKRRHEIQLVAQGFLPITQYTMPQLIRSPTQAPSRLLMSQRAKVGGTLYQRAKPQAFSEPEIRFLRNNPSVPSPKLTSQFNIIFGTNRTQSSVYYKRYRVLRSEPTTQWQEFPH